MGLISEHNGTHPVILINNDIALIFVFRQFDRNENNLGFVDPPVPFYLIVVPFYLTAVPSYLSTYTFCKRMVHIHKLFGRSR